MGAIEYLTIQVDAGNGVTKVALAGELDMGSTPMLNAALASLVLAQDGNGVSAILLDLRNLSFMDSSGLHALVQAKERCGPHTPLVVIGASPIVRQVFEITGMESLLDDEATVRTLDRFMGDGKASFMGDGQVGRTEGSGTAADV